MAELNNTGKVVSLDAFGTSFGGAMPDMFEVRKALPTGPQLRSYPAQFEVRSLAGSKVELRGYASTFEAPYEMFDMFGSYSEIVDPGAFAKTLAEGADVAYLSNHEGLTMARTKSGSLRLSTDEHGLEAVAAVNTTRGDVRDLVTAIEDGDVDEMSFAFRVVRQQWSPDYDERRLVELNLNRGDVSAVNYGANPNTAVSLQRAFRSRRAAEYHRAAVEAREGKQISAATAEILSQVLELCATADDAVDQAQPLLAGLLGVPNPDDPNETEGAADDTERGATELDLLRRRHQHEADRPRWIVGV